MPLHETDHNIPFVRSATATTSMEPFGFGTWALCTKAVILLLTISWLGFDDPPWIVSSSSSSLPSSSIAAEVLPANLEEASAHLLPSPSLGTPSRPLSTPSATALSPTPSSDKTQPAVSATTSDTPSATSADGTGIEPDTVNRDHRDSNRHHPTMTRQTVSSGTVFEQKYGYSRAVKTGNLIFVSGTVAAGMDGDVVGPGDAAAQARFALRKIETALQQLGAGLADVVRTRVYVADRAHALDVATVHGEVFGDIRPCNTLVVASLIEDKYLVEIEADAVIGSASSSTGTGI